MSFYLDKQEAPTNPRTSQADIAINASSTLIVSNNTPPRIPAYRPAALLENLHDQGERRIYNTLVMLAYLMDQTSPDHHFKIRLGGKASRQR
jgi:hypothetical protein